MSILNVNQIQPVGSGQTVTISAANITASSATITANTFSGALSSSGISTFSDTVNVGAGKSIRLYGATSGYSDIIAAAGSASTTFTLPANGGSASQYLQTDGAGALSWQTVTSGATWSESTASSLSGASQEWTGIPSDARQILITHHGWSNASSSQHWCQIGDSGGFETTGYYTSNFYAGSSTAGGGNFANAAAFVQGQATDPSVECTGLITITRLNSTNQWVVQWFYSVNNGNVYGTVGNKSLSGTLDRVRILPSTGNFDAGRANLMYLS